MQRLALVAALLAALSCTAAASSAALAWSSTPCFDGAEALSFASQLPVSQLADAFVAPSLASDAVTFVFLTPTLSVTDLTALSLSASASFVKQAADAAASQRFAPLANTNGLLHQLERVAAAANVTVARWPLPEGEQATPLQPPALVVAELDAPLAESDATIKAIVAALAPSNAHTSVLVAGAQAAPLANKRERRDVGTPLPPNTFEHPPYVTTRIQQRHERANQWFSIPILMGMIVGFFIVVMMLMGVHGLVNTQTMQRWPDANHDKNIQVPQ